MKTLAQLPKNTISYSSSALLALLLVACGGGGGESASEPSSVTAAQAQDLSPAPEPTPAPAPAPAPVPVATCTPGVVLATRFREVYKACVAGVNTNYDRTECVKDSTTGLTWEGKPTTGPRQSTNGYTNYDDLTKLQVFTFVPNTYRVPTAAEISAGTNTVGYVAAVNTTNLCGYSNWRLPTKTELLGIVDASSAPTGPTINTAWFPNTQANGYWASDAFLTDETAVGVYFNLGLDTNFSRTYNARVRLVRN